MRSIAFKRELKVPVTYKGRRIETFLRCDFLVENSLVVELKAADGIAPVFLAQLLTYMKVLRKPKGLLINFNVTNIFKEGQRTMVNELYQELAEK